MTPLTATTSLILLTDTQQPCPLFSDLDKITNSSNPIFLPYPYCPPFAFSLTPHHYLHPLFVHLHRPSSSSLLLFPLSPAVPFVMLCTGLFCARALQQAKTLQQFFFLNNTTTFFRNVSPTNSGVKQVCLCVCDYIYIYIYFFVKCIFGDLGDMTL